MCPTENSSVQYSTVQTYGTSVAYRVQTFEFIDRRNEGERSVIENFETWFIIIIISRSIKSAIPGLYLHNVRIGTFDYLDQVIYV